MPGQFSNVGGGLLAQAGNAGGLMPITENCCSCNGSWRLYNCSDGSPTPYYVSPAPPAANNGSVVYYSAMCYVLGPGIATNDVTTEVTLIDTCWNASCGTYALPLSPCGTCDDGPCGDATPPGPFYLPWGDGTQPVPSGIVHYGGFCYSLGSEPVLISSLPSGYTPITAPVTTGEDCSSAGCSCCCVTIHDSSNYSQTSICSYGCNSVLEIDGHWIQQILGAHPPYNVSCAVSGAGLGWRECGVWGNTGGTDTGATIVETNMTTGEVTRIPGLIISISTTTDVGFVWGVGGGIAFTGQSADCDGGHLNRASPANDTIQNVDITISIGGNGNCGVVQVEPP